MKKGTIIIICIIGFFVTLMLNKCSHENDIQSDKQSEVMRSPDKITRLEVTKQWSRSIQVDDWNNSEIITVPSCLINLKISKEQKIHIFKFLNTKKRNSLGDFDFDFMSFKLPKNSEFKKVKVVIFTKSKF